MSIKLPNIVFLVDTSGSMSSWRDTVERHLLHIHKNMDGKQAKVGIATFDDQYNRIQWVNPRINIGGGTQLFDSAVAFIGEMTSHFSAADKCLLIMVTDGGDTSNRPQGAATVKSEVTMAEDILGWDFLYVGTNQNAYKVGDNMGVKASKSLSFANSSEGFENMLKALEGICSKWAAGNIGHDEEFFTEETRSVQERLGAVKFQS